MYTLSYATYASVEEREREEEKKVFFGVFRRVKSKKTKKKIRTIREGVRSFQGPSSESLVHARRLFVFVRNVGAREKGSLVRLSEGTLVDSK